MWYTGTKPRSGSLAGQLSLTTFPFLCLGRRRRPILARVIIEGAQVKTRYQLLLSKPLRVVAGCFLGLILLVSLQASSHAALPRFASSYSYQLRYPADLLFGKEQSSSPGKPVPGPVQPTATPTARSAPPLALPPPVTAASFSAQATASSCTNLANWQCVETRPGLSLCRANNICVVKVDLNNNSLRPRVVIAPNGGTAWLSSMAANVGALAAISMATTSVGVPI